MGVREGGEGGLSAIKNFPDIHGKGSKSGDFSRNVLENKVMENIFVSGITGCHDNTVFDAMFGEVLLF